MIGLVASGTEYLGQGTTLEEQIRRFKALPYRTRFGTEECLPCPCRALFVCPYWLQSPKSSSSETPGNSRGVNFHWESDEGLDCCLFCHCALPNNPFPVDLYRICPLRGFNRLFRLLYNQFSLASTPHVCLPPPSGFGPLYCPPAPPFQGHLVLLRPQ